MEPRTDWLVVRWRSSAGLLRLVVGYVVGSVVLVLLAGCRGQQAAASDLQIDLRIAPTPAIVGPAEVMIEVRDAAGRPVSGAVVTLTGMMTHAGMAPVAAAARDSGNGRYRGDGFTFTMAGDWVLIVEATAPDGQRATRTFDIKGVTVEGSP